MISKQVMEVQAPYDGVDWTQYVVLQSNDQPKPVEFKVLRDAAKLSGLIKDMLEDQAEGEQTVIPIPNVNGRTLKYVLDYVNHHHNNKAETIEKPLKGKIEDVISEWDKQFLFTDLVRGHDEKQHELLIDVIMAANFLNIKDLLDLTCVVRGVDDQGQDAGADSRPLHIENDFTPEEEEKIKEENRWCEDS